MPKRAWHFYFLKNCHEVSKNAKFAFLTLKMPSWQPYNREQGVQGQGISKSNVDSQSRTRKTRTSSSFCQTRQTRPLCRKSYMAQLRKLAYKVRNTQHMALGILSIGVQDLAQGPSRLGLVQGPRDVFQARLGQVRLGIVKTGLLYSPCSSSL